jgi:hypothetical protein
MRGGRRSILFTVDCKKILGIPRFAANGVAEIEEGRDSRRAKVLCLAVLL